MMAASVRLDGRVRCNGRVRHSGRVHLVGRVCGRSLLESDTSTTPTALGEPLGNPSVRGCTSALVLAAFLLGINHLRNRAGSRAVPLVGLCCPVGGTLLSHWWGTP